MLFSLAMGLAGCNSMGLDGAPSGGFDASHTPDAIPRAEALSKSGNKPSYVVRGKRYYVLKDAKGYDKIGNASWYGNKFQGQRTSSEEPYNMYSMTAASTTLPIPSYVRVTNLDNGRTAVVRVNDRGPFHSNRIIDLSYAAAKKLGYTGIGTAKVRVTGIDTGSSSSTGLFAQNNVTSPSVVEETIKPIISKTSSQIASLKSQSKPIQLAQLTQNHGSLVSPLNSTGYTARHSNTSRTFLRDNALTETSVLKGQRYIQVGSFHTRSGAENMSKRITRLTQPVQVAVKEGMSSGSRVYRVHVGPLKDSEHSHQMAQLLAKNGFDNTTVVRG